MYYKIYPLKIGTFYLDHASLCYQTDFGKKILCPVEAFLVSGEDGTNILVDTGCCGYEWGESHGHSPVTYSEKSLFEMLADHNLSADDIKIVVNTHLHWDHCFNNAAFKNATIYVQKTELEFAKDPIPSMRYAYEARLEGVNPPWWDSRENFKVIDGDYDLCEGIRLMHLPGHTPGSQAVMVDTEVGLICIAGDVIQTYDCLNDPQEGLPKPCGAHTNLEVYYPSLKRLMECKPVEIIPGHDMRVFDHECYPY